MTFVGASENEIPKINMGAPRNNTFENVPFKKTVARTEKVSHDKITVFANPNFPALQLSGKFSKRGCVSLVFLVHTCVGASSE